MDFLSTCWLVSSLSACLLTEERQTPELYAANVRKVMGEALGAELSTHGIPQQQALKRNGIYVDWTGRYVLHPTAVHILVSQHKHVCAKKHKLAATVSVLLLTHECYLPPMLELLMISTPCLPANNCCWLNSSQTAI